MNFAPVIAAQWPEPAENEKNIAWVRDYWAALHEYSAPGGYINFQDADDQSRIEDTLGSNYPRLAGLKAKYDPDNFFHINQNIKPAAPAAGGVPSPAPVVLLTPPPADSAPADAAPPQASPPEAAPTA
ncbi:hypothetical protein QF038_002213 [Pseudarthrobacter sp. W1I19]|uniref:BBE domain-containing protein n=1 Tax=Pseudarthrobacter sp. W1I19 TaxID=3042288 RepID=UPI0027812E6C|nr:BBE domain-containing protein [Pseudarthrobacter sp. W1I19]MDQ0923705.1 hypothetical protein [Pseudarthrobacter sp. W1I19]